MALTKEWLQSINGRPGIKALQRSAQFTFWLNVISYCSLAMLSEIFSNFHSKVSDKVDGAFEYGRHL